MVNFKQISNNNNDNNNNNNNNSNNNNNNNNDNNSNYNNSITGYALSSVNRTDVSSREENQD